MRYIEPPHGADHYIRGTKDGRVDAWIETVDDHIEVETDNVRINGMPIYLPSGMEESIHIRHAHEIIIDDDHDWLKINGEISDELYPDRFSSVK